MGSSAKAHPSGLHARKSVFLWNRKVAVRLLKTPKTDAAAVRFKGSNLPTKVSNSGPSGSRSLERSSKANPVW